MSERGKRDMAGQRQALVVTLHDVSRDGRPRRMARWLRDRYAVTLAGPGQWDDDPSVRHLPLPARLRSAFPERMAFAFNGITRRYEAALSCRALAELERRIAGEFYDLIVVHDPELLPLAMRCKGSARVVFDAREYYPDQFPERWLWRWRDRPIYSWLCRNFMPLTDLNVTVSDGLRQRYESEFGVEAKVLESWPDYHALEPTPVDAGRIRLIHHGSSNANRRIEGMIEMMDYLDSRFELDIFLLPGEPAYLTFLRGEASRRDRVHIRPALPHGELVPCGNRYDIGVFLVPPSTFNLEQALPNKFFEFIQSRLAVAIGPSPAMREWAERLGVGIIAADFSPRAMAEALNRLTADDIRQLKSAAHLAADEFNSRAGGVRFLAMLDEQRCRIPADFRRDRVRDLYAGVLPRQGAAVRAIPASDPQWRALQGLLPGGGAALRVLDAGCGDGAYANALAATGQAEVTAVDLFEQVPSLSPAVTYLRASVDALPFPDGSFDVVYSMSVIYYLEDPSAALSEFHRVLRPGGRLLFTAHTDYSFYTLLRRFRRRFNAPRWPHLQDIRFMSLAAFCRITGHSGFRLLRIGGWSPGSVLCLVPVHSRLAPFARVAAEFRYHSVVIAEKPSVDSPPC